MTGKAREHEVRIMGLGLAALAVLAAVTVFWLASAIGGQLRTPAPNAYAEQSGSSGVVLDHR